MARFAVPVLGLLITCAAGCTSQTDDTSADKSTEGAPLNRAPSPKPASQLGQLLGRERPIFLVVRTEAYDRQVVSRLFSNLIAVLQRASAADLNMVWATAGRLDLHEQLLDDMHDTLGDSPAVAQVADRYLGHLGFWSPPPDEIYQDRFNKHMVIGLLSNPIHWTMVWLDEPTEGNVHGTDTCPGSVILLGAFDPSNWKEAYDRLRSGDIPPPECEFPTLLLAFNRERDYQWKSNNHTDGIDSIVGIDNIYHYLDIEERLADE